LLTAVTVTSDSLSPGGPNINCRSRKFNPVGFAR
jgi:hypothetical protein